MSRSARVHYRLNTGRGALAAGLELCLKFQQHSPWLHLSYLYSFRRSRVQLPQWGSGLPLVLIWPLLCYFTYPTSCWNRQIFLEHSMRFYETLCPRSSPAPEDSSCTVIQGYFPVFSRRFYPSEMSIMSQSLLSYWELTHFHRLHQHFIMIKYTMDILLKLRYMSWNMTDWDKWYEGTMKVRCHQERFISTDLTHPPLYHGSSSIC